jgi:hypothetical protein
MAEKVALDPFETRLKPLTADKGKYYKNNQK